MKFRLFLGIVLVSVGLVVILGSIQKRKDKQDFVSETLSSEPLKIEGFEGKKVEEILIPQKIVIPNLKIDLNIKRAEIVKGYWQVFYNVANWGEGSGIPGKNGNIVVFAHAQKGLFLNLKDVNLEDRIYLLTKDKWFTYQVREIKIVTPNQVEVLKPIDSEEILTLYTCSGLEDEKRFIVIAKRME